jgi:hypothetical protein
MAKASVKEAINRDRCTRRELTAMKRRRLPSSFHKSSRRTELPFLDFSQESRKGREYSYHEESRILDAYWLCLTDVADLYSARVGI